jgi:hypothetical protein
MTLIGRKKTKSPLEQVLEYLGLVLKALVAQRVARKAHKGYKRARRVPLVLVALVIVAIVLRKKQQSSADAEPAPSATV